jgi:Lar family restriction alleviation protein
MKPCPFCGQKVLSMRHALADKWYWRYCCRICGTEGPQADTEDAADALWEQREAGRANF